MRNDIWATLNGVGILRIEEYLVVSNEPILFTCKNEKTNQRFLVMLYDEENFEYVVSPVSAYDLADMLDNQISMEQTFRKKGIIYFTHGQFDQVIVEEFDSKSFSSDYLPEKDEFFDLKPNYIDRYISALRKEPSDILDYVINRNFYTDLLDYSYMKYCDSIDDLGNENDFDDKLYKIKQSVDNSVEENNVSDNMDFSAA
jgi:hypothetical protein